MYYKSNYSIKGNINSYLLVVPDVPASPEGPLVVENICQESVDLTWQPPKSDGGLPIQNYYIEYKQPNRATWVKGGVTSGPDTKFTVANLQEGAEYLFRVSAVNAEGSSKPLETESAVVPTKSVGKGFLINYTSALKKSISFLIQKTRIVL